MRFLFLFLLRILSFKVSALKKLKNQNKTPYYSWFVLRPAKGHRILTWTQKCFSKLLLSASKSWCRENVGSFSRTGRAQSSKFWRGRMLLYTKGENCLIGNISVFVVICQSASKMIIICEYAVAIGLKKLDYYTRCSIFFMMSFIFHWNVLEIENFSVCFCRCLWEFVVALSLKSIGCNTGFDFIVLPG